MKKFIASVSVQLLLAVLLAAFFSARAQDSEFRSLNEIGTIELFAGTPPDPSSGWLVADGSCISRTTYAALFAVIGEVFGGCDFSTTFALPDLRGRVPIGAGDGNETSPRTLADMFGEETHQILTGELPSHSHTVTDPGHSHNITRYNGTNAGAVLMSQWQSALNPPHTTPGFTQSNTTGITIGSTGNNTEMNVMDPHLVVNFLVWAGTVELDIASDVVITVVVVFPTHTPTPTPTATLTPTDGPSPTPTFTPSPTGQPAYQTSYTVNGQEVLMTYEVTPGDAALVGLLFLVVCLIVYGYFHYMRRKIT